MKPPSSHLCKAAVLLAAITLLPVALASEGISMGEDYYGNNIEAAVTEAKQSKRKGNYDNRYWYSRTTSKSFELPNMQADALEQERLEGALGATQAGEANTPNKKSNDTEHAIITERDNVSSQKNIKTQATRIQSTERPTIVIEPTPTSSSHKSAQGFTATQGVISSSTLISTSRP